jgi:predicted RNA binding protein YcfA (HicA-like mRNA interferase family)
MAADARRRVAAVAGLGRATESLLGRTTGCRAVTIDGIPSLKAKKLLKLLTGMGYVIVRQNGSHRQLRCDGRGPVVFSFHDGSEVPPHLVRSTLVKQAGLTIEEAREVIRNG